VFGELCRLKGAPWRLRIGAKKASHSMTRRVDELRAKAAECERMASRAVDETARVTYRDMAQQWREMADQQETIDRMRNSN